ncbi:MAG: hypothetical protein KJ587_02030 [Alphaproteobacteria bacterium]|nr:hypothetical protein [Alphaproteobacteria bacterium]
MERYDRCLMTMISTRLIRYGETVKNEARAGGATAINEDINKSPQR